MINPQNVEMRNGEAFEIMLILKRRLPYFEGFK